MATNSPEYMRQWRANNRQKKREHDMRSYYKRGQWRAKERLYGITKEQYEAMIVQQNNCCAVCKQPLSGKIVVDHNHTTGKVRGILHSMCNLMVGHFENNLEAAKLALQYVES